MEEIQCLIAIHNVPGCVKGNVYYGSKINEDIWITNDKKEKIKVNMDNFLLLDNSTIYQILNKYSNTAKYETKTVSLPKLNKLTPSFYSCFLKVYEELGELSQALGKFNGESGEEITLTREELAVKTGEELLDSWQALTTLTFLIEEKYELDINKNMDKHIEKMINKNYLGVE